MLNFHRLLVIPATAGLMLITAWQPSFAQDAAAVRAGDSMLSCEAIITEINTLTTAAAEQAQRAESRARAGRGFMNFARGALTMAAPVLAQGALGGMGSMGGDGVGAAIAQSAIQQAQIEAQSQAMTAAMTAGQPQVDAYGRPVQPEQSQPAPPAQSPRVQHLNALFMQRGC